MIIQSYKIFIKQKENYKFAPAIHCIEGHNLVDNPCTA